MRFKYMRFKKELKCFSTSIIQKEFYRYEIHMIYPGHYYFASISSWFPRTSQ